MNQELKYLRLLAEKYPSTQVALREMVRLEASLHLAKGAEIFLSDIHGEHEAFDHLLRNGSGVVKQRLLRLFHQEMTPEKMDALATLIYYPEEKMALMRNAESAIEADLQLLVYPMVRLVSDFAAGYSDSHLREVMPNTYGKLILELMRHQQEPGNAGYFEELLANLTRSEQLGAFIIDLSAFIRALAVDRIHVIGDIFDRGPGAEIIMDGLISKKRVDIQWGNHDIVWMGAALGSRACMANVIRLSLRYGNTDTLEKGYGIHLMPLVSFALEHYKADKGIVFDPKVPADELLNQSEKWLSRLMHKAISIIQFKLEGQLLMRRPEFDMSDRMLLHRIDLERGVLNMGEMPQVLSDTFFPTLRTARPYELTPEEEEVMRKLESSFLKSARLNTHVRFLLDQGSMYKITNDLLLYHGCIPLDAQGNFRTVDIGYGSFAGKELMDFFNGQVIHLRNAVPGSAAHSLGLDIMWYLWAGPNSPLFGKDRMATFERYFLLNQHLHKEKKDFYYQFRDSPEVCSRILHEFGLVSDDACILNGHVPVSVKKGENPVKAKGKLIVIDGGFSKAYQSQTGIAGYTFIADDLGRHLIAHEPFGTKEEAIVNEIDIVVNDRQVLMEHCKRLTAGDMPDSQQLRSRISDLANLIRAFKMGDLKEHSF